MKNRLLTAATQSLLFAAIVPSAALAWAPAQSGFKYGASLWQYEVGPWNVHPCDLDGDGDADLLAGSGAEDQVLWFENLGGGRFGARKVIAEDVLSVRQVRTADLDGDGDLDVLSASELDDTIGWYENFGSDVFGPRQVISSTASGASSVGAADLDGDGDVDVLSAASASGQIAWYENLGGGAFGARSLWGSANGCRSVDAADLDGDGDLDVLWSAEGNNEVAWQRNLGGGSFASPQSVSTAVIGVYDALAADIDGDGALDLVAAEFWGDRVSWFRNLGGGVFGSKQAVAALISAPSDVSTADLDGDGDLDVLISCVVVGSQPEIVWCENVGAGLGPDGGHFLYSQTIGFALLGLGVESADLDGDGDADVISASQGNFGGFLNNESGGLAWYENDSGASWPKTLVTQAVVSPQDVHAADLDGDGDDDALVAFGGGDRIAWYENLGAAQFGGQQTISVAVQGPTSVYTSDLDGDGDLDVLSASELDNTIAWYENLDGSEFGPRLVISSSAVGAQQVRSADIDGDGDMDVLSASAGDDTVAWYENLGGGAFGGAQVISSTATGAYGLDAADLDLDGDVDVVFACSDKDSVEWAANLGGGAFGGPQTISSNAQGARRVQVADVTGDGIPDVVAACFTGSKVVYHRGLGGGAFAPVGYVMKWLFQVSGFDLVDLDLDGDLDLISAAYSTAMDGVLFRSENTGAGVFANSISIGLPAFMTGTVASDLDGDGDADLLYVSEGFGAIQPLPEVKWYENLLAFPDCNGNGVQDLVDLSTGVELDCDGNNVPDSCDLLVPGADANGNGVLDACELSLIAALTPDGAWYTENELVLFGANFDVGLPATVSLGGQAPLSANLISDDLMRVTVPANFLQGAGPIDVAVAQGGAVSSASGGFTVLPTVDVDLVGDLALGGSAEFRVTSVQGGTAYAYFSPLVSPVPLTFAGIHGAVELEIGYALQVGSGSLTGDPAVTVALPPGIPSGLLLPTQVLVVEVGALGTYFSFTELELVPVP